MSKRYWGNVVATGPIIGRGLFVLIFVASSYVIGEGNCRKYDQSGAVNANQKNKQIPCNAPEWWRMTQRLVRSEDTLAQWITAVLGFLSLIVSAVAVYFVRASLDLNRAAVDAAVEGNRNTLISIEAERAHRRPWLSILDVQITDVKLAPWGPGEGYTHTVWIIGYYNI